jgi:hypothetical protein
LKNASKDGRFLILPEGMRAVDALSQDADRRFLDQNGGLWNGPWAHFLFPEFGALVGAVCAQRACGVRLDRYWMAFIQEVRPRWPLCDFRDQG